MTRFALVAIAGAVVAVAAVASTMVGCGGDVLWSFTYVDASTASASSIAIEAGNEAAAQVQDAAPDRDRNAPPAPSGCPQPVGPSTSDCLACKTDVDCTRDSIDQFQCGSEGRCVECTTDDQCNPDGGKQFICFDEHCVLSCDSHRDCEDNNLFFGCSPDAGYCFECTRNPSNGNCDCNFDGICVECVGPQSCVNGTCSANGYCSGL